LEDVRREAGSPGQPTNSRAAYGDFPSERAPFDFNAAGRWPPNVVFSHAPGCVLEGTRVVKGDSATRQPRKPHERWREMEGRDDRPESGGVDRRSWSADGTETVAAWRCVEGCPVRDLDRQSGTRRSGGKRGAVYTTDDAPVACYGAGVNGRTSPAISDAGTASRFFPQFPHDPEAAELTAFLYAAKASKADRTAGGRVPNAHATVKSTALMRWLCRLVTPPGGRVLDPFAGSGTTLVACALEGFGALGIELDPDYAATARARLAAAEPAPASDGPLFAATSSPGVCP
jgi:hypothetical protein